MYAYVELSNVACTDSVIQSLSWMNYVANSTRNPTDDTTSNQNTISQNSISPRDGWLATGNTNHIVSVTFTSTRANEHLTMPDRTNFNLRGHRSDIRLVSWNAPYQKLATVDEKGIIFVWVKHENRWSLELINERNHPAVDMAWSHDGQMTVICYEDGYVLVGSVAGQRYWSTVVNTPQAKLSAVTWMPDASHVILGTTAGNLILMDRHGNTTEDINISKQAIRQLMYSCGKFYPGSPDSNATKYVNDDYILACSLENGHVLFLYGYQDSSPIVVDTELQNIEMDWSCSNEILAVAGHRRLNDSNYHNEIQFYTRRGEFLYRLHIPQTAQSLSALCWAHENSIVFVACGSSVYTVWVTHKPLPSMLTLCQMKIKNALLNNSLTHVDRLSLPRSLRENLLGFYRSTIKGFLPDPKSLRSFVCYPLKSNLRLQCTMKRIDLDIENSSSTNSTNYSGPIYVLYLEYLGGLIPLLTAKRASKICPDFIIFDPEMASSHLSFDSVTSKNKSRSPTVDRLTSANESNRSPTSTSENQRAEDCRSLANRSSSGFSSDNDSNDDDDDDDDRRREKTSRKKPTSKLIKHKHNNKLCTIGANIWGTRFKFYGHSEYLPEILGTVTYKTSFLHLQPRQMTVTVASNYDQSKNISSNITKSHSMAMNKIKSQSTRKKVMQQDDDGKINGISSSKTNINGSIPIAPMSPQLASVVRSTTTATLNQQESVSSTINEINSSQQTKKIFTSGCQRISMNTASTIVHPRFRSFQFDSSAADSSSTSPNNLSRSTSPAASIANFIRPISPPCIQMREALSPKMSRLISNSVTQRSCSPPRTSIPSMANNIDASTASAMTTLNIDDSSGYDSSENPNQRRSATTTTNVSTVPETCFEPETYRNVHQPNTNSQKQISVSDPTLNQTNRSTQASNTSNVDPNVSVSSSPEPMVSDEQITQIDNDLDQSNQNDDAENDRNIREKSRGKSFSNRRTARHKFNSPRHRIITCTSAMNDSSTRLSSSSNENRKSKRRNDSPETTSFYVMQNRPPLWNEQTQVYQLDFGGRVTLESAKNFQIELKDKQVIQFGRIENNCYTLDFEWPFSPLQAFAVALANITQRLK